MLLTLEGGGRGMYKEVGYICTPRARQLRGSRKKNRLRPSAIALFIVLCCIMLNLLHSVNHACMHTNETSML